MERVEPDKEFYRIKKLPPYVFAVINEMKAKARAAQLDVVDLGMGNPDGAAPRAVVSKLVEAARNPRNHRYSLSKGIPQLRNEIVTRYQRNYGVELDPEQEAIVTIGAKDALAHLLFAVIGPGDTVVSPNPCYPIHQYGVIMAEGQACMLPMPDPAVFLERLEDLYRKSASKPAMLLLSFPHNPTTQCVDLDFFKTIVRLAAHHGTMVVHDFAYADLGFDGYKPPSILQVDGAKEVAVEIFSLSKSYIADVLDMTVDEAVTFFRAVPQIYDPLLTLAEVGLGYIGLGQSATTLSGGEAQRVKLAAELSRKATGRTLYILDEPTTGLHFHDVAKLLEVLFKLRASGNTLLVIEHNLEVIKTADWILDLGPEGGDAGGQIIAQGSPEVVAKSPGSHTGQYLASVLKR